MARQALDAVAEHFQTHLAFDAVRPGDRGQRDPALATVTRGQLLGLLFGFGLGRILSRRIHVVVGAFGGSFLGRSLGGVGFDNLFLASGGFSGNGLFGRNIGGLRRSLLLGGFLGLG